MNAVRRQKNTVGRRASLWYKFILVIDLQGGGDLTAKREFMVRKMAMRMVVIGLAGCAALAAPATSQRPALAMLDQIESGRWEVRLRDGTRRSYPICVDNGRKLIQLRHDALNCEKLIVEDRADQVTVQYTCRGRGYGRTSIRRETGRLVQIETQGIAEGQPFDFAAEARHTGSCGD
jgi:hypothetical protein